MNKRNKKPVSRKQYDDMRASVEKSIEMLAQATNREITYITRVRDLTQARTAAEVERDNLKKEVEILRERGNMWRNNAISEGKRIDRLRRHRELLLDVMTSAEDAGADFSSIHRGDGFNAGDEVKS